MKQIILRMTLVMLTFLLSMQLLSAAPLPTNGNKIAFYKVTDHHYELTLPDEITTVIADPNLLFTLRNLTENDTLVLYIAGYGGDVQSGLQLLNALVDSKAKIKVIVSAGAHSMHALLACVSKDIDIRPGSFLMFHTYSVTVRGKGSESIALLTALNKALRDILYGHCVANKVLTKDEVSKILSGQDIYKD